MGAAEVIGWILLILGGLNSIRGMLRTAKEPIMNLVITAVLVIVGLILLFKNKK